MMLTPFLMLMCLVVLASIMQTNYKIPSPITLMSVVLLAAAFGFKAFNVTDHQFDSLVLFSLPLLIASDAFKLNWYDLKEHAFGLFWMAVVSVVLAVFAGVLINDYVLLNYDLSLAAVVVLFSMVTATDPITVGAIFSSFKIPHKLKVLTEGESLFNDATALIMFSIALVALNDSNKVSAGFIAYKSISVFVGAITIGLIFGYLTTVALRLSSDPFVEASIILIAAYASYVSAEHFHFSGILAVIVCAVLANKVIQKVIHDDEAEIDVASKFKNMGLLKHAITTKDNHQTIVKSIEFVGMFASATLFISVASIVDFAKLYDHKHEIIAVFVASTVIRGLMMLKFAVVSNNVKRMQNIQKHWWAVLTFAGSKGALSILMVHMIPANFQYKDLFETIIIGNILLSIFVYSAILSFVVVKNKIKFEKECDLEDAH